jgi:hypothetical protein
MSAEYTATDMDVLKTCLLELAQQARRGDVEAHPTERERVVAQAILEDV